MSLLIYFTSLLRWINYFPPKTRLCRPVIIHRLYVLKVYVTLELINLVSHLQLPNILVNHFIWLPNFDNKLNRLVGITLWIKFIFVLVTCCIKKRMLHPCADPEKSPYTSCLVTQWSYYYQLGKSICLYIQPLNLQVFENE